MDCVIESLFKRVVLFHFEYDTCFLEKTENNSCIEYEFRSCSCNDKNIANVQQGKLTLFLYSNFNVDSFKDCRSVCSGMCGLNEKKNLIHLCQRCTSLLHNCYFWCTELIIPVDFNILTVDCYQQFIIISFYYGIELFFAQNLKFSVFLEMYSTERVHWACLSLKMINVNNFYL